MGERGEFEMDEDFQDEGTEDLDRMLGGDRKPRPGRKIPQAAWSRVEDVLAERRLERELTDDYGLDEG